MCVCCMHTYMSRHTCGSQRTICRSWLFLPLFPPRHHVEHRAQTKVARLGSKHLYSLSHRFSSPFFETEFSYVSQAGLELTTVCCNFLIFYKNVVTRSFILSSGDRIQGLT